MAVFAPPFDDRLTQAGPLLGFDPNSVPAGWLEPLSAAGIPFAPAGEAWQLHLDPLATKPVINADGALILPSLACFRTLTSLPLKPVRVWIQQRFGMRLRVATGIHMWLWSHHLAVVNHSDSPRSGFLHGPQHGMRTVIALDPGQHQVVTW